MKNIIMLVSGDPVLKRDVRRFFSTAPDVSISIETTDLAKILHLLKIEQTKETNFIIFDLDFFKIEEMTDFMARCNEFLPGVAKIVCSEGQFVAGPDILNKVMKLGNIHFVVKPIRAEGLREIMGFSDALPSETSKNGKIFTFISSSGGTGKTSVIVNLAWAIARERPDSRIALFDFNPGFGAIAVNLNLKSGYLNTFESLAEEFKNYDVVDEDIFRKHFIELGNIDVLPSQSSLGDIDPSCRERAEAVLERARAFYDFILIDTSSHIEDQLLSSAVIKADRVFSVFIPRVYDVRNTKIMTRLLRDLNIPMNRHLFIINRLGPDDDIRVKDIEKLIGARPLIRIREDFATIALASDQGVPSAAKHPTGDLARDIRALARAVTKDDFTEFASHKAPTGEAVWKKLSSLWS